MLMLLNGVLHKVRDERGVVSMEWILLGAVIAGAVVAAFSPAFSTLLTDGMTAISTLVAAQLP
jgi:Flp pilus assembly pilin Flp